ncbi:hypothetical protein AGMMS50249_2980 [candidate division SR1 bacterium]|nr:hypothetical protein AGMMS50249_2980 [candidate division SR1 bacterium]
MYLESVQKLLKKFYTGNRQDIVDEIWDFYLKSKYCVINFLYYPQIIGFHQFENEKSMSLMEKKYRKTILRSAFLLPDGIALQIYYFCAVKLKKIDSPTAHLNNLNGTDFTPYFLVEIEKKIGKHKLGLICYGAREENLEKACYYLGGLGFDVIYAQEGFSEFDWKTAHKAIKESDKEVFIMLQGRSTPTKPLQELWTDENRENIQKNQLILLNVGGLFDWRSGDQKRAPILVRKAKLERLRRFISNPKRNFQKILNTAKGAPHLFSLPFAR